MIKSVYLTHSGKVRESNEDSILVTTNIVGDTIAVVADGMGGHNAGDIASAIIVKEICQAFVNLTESYPINKMKKWLQKEVIRVNDKILRLSRNNENLTGMGSTAVIAIVTEDYTLVSNVGDSRCYILKKNKLFQVTRDHSLVNQMIDNGKISEEDALYYPHKNVIMQAIGTNESFQLDMFEINNSYQKLILCSDGVTDYVTDSKLEKALKEKTNIKKIADKIIEMSLHYGGLDNISVSILEMEVKK